MITLPASGSISRRVERATVDLPQPDSPTSPRVRPPEIANETPSTARTTRRGRPPRRPRGGGPPPPERAGAGGKMVGGPPPPGGGGGGGGGGGEPSRTR